MWYEKNGELWSDATHHPLNAVRCEVADANGAKVIYHTGLRIVGGQATYTDDRSVLCSNSSRFYKPTRLYFWVRCVACGYTFSQAEAEYRSRFGPIQKGRVSHFVTLNYPFPHYRAEEFADILKCKPEELLEIFTPPETRGIGDWWVGERGTLIQDYGTPPNPEDFFSKYICNDAFLNIKATQESINGKDTYVATEEMLRKQEETLGKPFIE